MAVMEEMELETVAEKKIEALKKFLGAQPPKDNGEAVLEMWDTLWDETTQSIQVETATGPSDDEENPVFPYEKIASLVGDGGNWKWPRMWQRLDELERRGEAYREGEALNLGQPNKAPNSQSFEVCVVGGGPVGLRLAIELLLGGHKVTILEKRREIRDAEGNLEVLGFTNRINRPHMWNFVRNDLAKLNGRDFLEQKCQYPVFTEPETSSIGIDELQCLLLKNALLLGVDFKLGAGYESAVPYVSDPETMTSRWRVTAKFDDILAAKKEGVEAGENFLEFDVLIGCDGPRSKVRDTMTKYLGDIEKRKFADCIGIVANVRKLSRKRLKELDFPFGQEPGDMNRTKLVFKDFFHKLNHEADADLEALIYYKAAYHNYCILTPKRANLVKHGLSGKVYHHTEARAALDGDPKAQEKAKLKEYCKRVLKAAGIPVDDQLPNEGFVAAPNDVMSFDFAECWNTKKSLAFELAPPGYSVASDGPYPGRALCPIVALAGDSLLEPFWPQGLGLKRGWHAVFDVCWLVDNIYNPEVTQKILKKDQVSWDEHFETLREQTAKHLEWCKSLRVTDELAKGAYAEKGPIVTQLRKFDRDMEIPPYEVEIDPCVFVHAFAGDRVSYRWTRYRELERECEQHWKYGLTGEEKDAWQHPIVKKAIAKHHFEADMRKNSKDEIVHKGKPLLKIGGKTVSHAANGGTAAGAKPASLAKIAKPPGSKRHAKAAPPPVAKPDLSNLAASAVAKRESLAEAAVAHGVEAKIAQAKLANKMPGAKPALPLAVLEETAHHGPAGDDGHQAAADKMWNTMSGAHLDSPHAEAELAKIRAMIHALELSLEAYHQAEHKLLVSGTVEEKSALPL